MEANQKNTHLLDTTKMIETPEGVDINLRVADPFIRVIAATIDLLIIGGLYIIVSLIVGLLAALLGAMSIGFYLLFIFLMYWWYPVLFEMFNHGATPGKAIMKIKVIQDNGIAVTWSSSIIRNLIKVVDFMPFLYGFGILSMLFNKHFKRLGDLAAGTIVILKDKVGATNTVIDDHSKQIPKYTLTLEEQETLLNFVERKDKFSTERQYELANLLEILTEHKDKEGNEILQNIANYYQGKIG